MRASDGMINANRILAEFWWEEFSFSKCDGGRILKELTDEMDMVW
jgi:hypothetical protein